MLKLFTDEQNSGWFSYQSTEMLNIYVSELVRKDFLCYLETQSSKFRKANTKTGI